MLIVIYIISMFQDKIKKKEKEIGSIESTDNYSLSKTKENQNVIFQNKKHLVALWIVQT